MKINRLIPIILIPFLGLFVYQATKASIADVQLSNAYYFLTNLNTKNKEVAQIWIDKARKALSSAGQLTPRNPDYHNLLANLKIWEARIDTTKEHSLQQAKKHYLLALQAQPNNPFLWSGLAITDRAAQPENYSLNAINRSYYYAPTDPLIQKQLVFWKLPRWSQLNAQQQKETINQLSIFLSNPKTGNKTRKQLNNLLTNNHQIKTICSKLDGKKKSIVCSR